MINKVVVNHFKKFARQEFDIPRHLVVVGPNNSGKTTLLQAISAWAGIAHEWRVQNPDLAREKDANYPKTNLNLLKFHSVPLADFAHLWTDKNVREPSSIWLHTNRWKIGFEIMYHETELSFIRPAKKVHEKDLEQYINDPLLPVYIPPLSGVEILEPSFNLADVLPARLAVGQGGSILRNLLVYVSQDAEKWKKLQSVILNFFGYKLDSPSGGAQIYARYRHSVESQSYDLSSAASGFLQVLMIYATLLYTTLLAREETCVFLIDEPDAHLHLLLQDKIYRDLYDFSQKTRSQLIIATHSERLINAVADADINNLRLLAGRLKEIPDKRKLVDTLELEDVDIMLAQTEQGILYTEGPSDLNILREWAQVLEHPLLSFLEKPFWKETAQNKRPAVAHFSAMRLLTHDFRGVELCDGDNKERRKRHTLPEGMQRLFWDRYEIESYLLHPKSIGRYVESKASREIVEKAEKYMKQQLPPALYENPFESSAFLLGTKAKNVLSNILQEAGLTVQESDFYQIAAQMTKEEIHPEVVQKLNAITDHFNLAGDENKTEDSHK